VVASLGKQLHASMADDLTANAVWTAVSQPPTFLGEEYATSVRATKTKQFFRLVRQ
jgi:hypothetical protein